jgi:hypothetical protein
LIYSDSQTLAANTLLGAPHTSEIANESYIGRNQQRSSFSGIESQKRRDELRLERANNIEPGLVLDSLMLRRVSEPA